MNAPSTLSFSRRLRDGHALFGTMFATAAPQWSAIAAAAGLDAAFIDTEHSPIDRGQVAWLCHAMRARGVAPLVRIPNMDASQARMALDNGAAGVIVPYVETVDQVVTMIGACKQRPLQGETLRGRLAGMDRQASTAFDSNLQTYVDNRCAENVLIIQIESVAAVEKIEQLVRCEGVGAVLFGPHDLTCSMGIPEQYDDPRLLAAVRTVCDACRRHGVAVGMPWWQSPESLKPFLDAGVTLVFYGSDVGLFQSALTTGVQQLRSLAAPSITPPGSDGSPC